MKFHVLSDLHLEFAHFELRRPAGADYLILAGDIGDPASAEYASLIRRASLLYSKTFVIKGNHECYSRTVEHASKLIAEVCSQHPNVVFLDNASHDISDDLRICGSTMWSEISEFEQLDVQYAIADFRLIREWSVERHNRAHSEAVQFLEREIQQRRKRLVVVTHHAPSMLNTSHPKYRGSPTNSAFATPLDHLVADPAVARWVFGHTHWSKHSGKLLSNQRGYPGEGGCCFGVDFDPLFTFEIDDAGPGPRVDVQPRT